MRGAYKELHRNETFCKPREKRCHFLTLYGRTFHKPDIRYNNCSITRLSPPQKTLCV